MYWVACGGRSERMDVCAGLPSAVAAFVQDEPSMTISVSSHAFCSFCSFGITVIELHSSQCMHAFMKVVFFTISLGIVDSKTSLKGNLI